ncbi:hypothetical protein [Pseudonocardia sp. NPDC049635]|uniref:hypothetical protein n=1 Tax=Pseudonocardia sp. NPDC049635 TaxID=3155506 RepID=UPI0033F8EF08
MATKMVISAGGNAYELHDMNWTMGELAAVQRHTGLKAAQFEAGLVDPDGNVLAVLAAMWISARRGGSTVSWEDFEAAQTWPVNTLEVDLVEVPDAPANREQRRAAAKTAKTPAGK